MTLGLGVRCQDQHGYLAHLLLLIPRSLRLPEVRGRTIDDMRLVNALCRFVELAV